MKTFLSILAACLLLAGCHPDGRTEAAATQGAIARTRAATADADQANAQAQAHLDAAQKEIDSAQSAVQDIDAKTRTLLQSP